MSRPELKFELDEYGRIVYRVTDEGVLLSKDEKEFIIDHVTRMQAENAKLRELVEDMAAEIRGLGIDFKRVGWCDYADRMRELGVDA